MLLTFLISFSVLGNFVLMLKKWQRNETENNNVTLQAGESGI